MPDQNDSRTPAEKFEAYNPYAERAIQSLASDDLGTAEVASNLAVAFALDRVRSEIHFGLKGRS